MIEHFGEKEKDLFFEGGKKKIQQPQKINRTHLHGINFLLGSALLFLPQVTEAAPLTSAHYVPMRLQRQTDTVVRLPTSSKEKYESKNNLFF